MAYHVFLATPKGMDEQTVQAFYDKVTERFIAALEGIELVLVKAEDDYREHFSRCGGWDAWTRDVGRGVDYMFRTPRYNCIVCVSRRVGKATADIVRHALEGDRMVIVMEGLDAPSQRIRSVREIDSQDYRAGWELVGEN
jgi:hypothetical protein